MNSPFFSIGIPAFKASFLKECIDSIITQTFKDFELIIVNDASPENIDEIVKEYSDSRIKYYVNEVNTGAEHVVDNWNKCLSYATGNYFVLMGDDDTMNTNYLSEFAELIDEYPNLDVFHCRSYIINSTSKRIMLTQSWAKRESVYENMWYRLNFLRSQYISDFVYRRDVLAKNGGFHKFTLAWASDDVSAYTAMANKGIAHTNQLLLNYRSNDQTISSTGDPKLKMRAILEVHDWLEDFLNKEIDNGENDQIYKLQIIKQLPKYTMKKQLSEIVQSYSSNIFKYLLYWLSHRKTYRIKTTLLIYSVLEYIKYRFV